MNRAVAVLKSLGCRVEDATLPPLQDYNAVGRVIISAEAYALHEATLQTRLSDYSRAFRIRVLSGALIRAAEYIAAQRRRTDLIAITAKAFERFDVLISTPAAGAAPLLSEQRRTTASAARWRPRWRMSRRCRRWWSAPGAPLPACRSVWRSSAPPGAMPRCCGSAITSNGKPAPATGVPIFSNAVRLARDARRRWHAIWSLARFRARSCAADWRPNFTIGIPSYRMRSSRGVGYQASKRLTHRAQRPRHAGAGHDFLRCNKGSWIPACAGMTGWVPAKIRSFGHLVISLMPRVRNETAGARHIDRRARVAPSPGTSPRRNPRTRQSSRRGTAIKQSQVSLRYRC